MEIINSIIILLLIFNINLIIEGKIISREEWIAQPPNNELNNLTLPVGKVIIAHTATGSCTTQAQCTFRTRYIQTFHMESRSFDDIAYNFLIGGDGNIYIGRDWNKAGAHTKGFNYETIGIAFIGIYGVANPTDSQLEAAKSLLEYGVENGKLTTDYKLYGHRDFIPTESPGEQLYNIIKKWPHYGQNNVIKTVMN